MRLRRGRADARRWPSGLAEVELFAFWEDDLARDVPPLRHPLSGEGTDPVPSPAPLGLAAGVAAVALVVVLLL